MPRNEAAADTLLFGDRFPFRYLVDDYGLHYYATFTGWSAEETAAEGAAAEDAAAEADAAETVEFDVDLTKMSSTMVYSEVYNMMLTPQDYVGKTVKMEGIYAFSKDDATGQLYHACIIQDATACCAQGIEFVLTDEYTYPDDYPAQGDMVCVSGVFDTYLEDKYLYCTLRDAHMES